MLPGLSLYSGGFTRFQGYTPKSASKLRPNWQETVVFLPSAYKVERFSCKTDSLQMPGSTEAQCPGGQSPSPFLDATHANSPRSAPAPPRGALGPLPPWVRFASLSQGKRVWFLRYRIPGEGERRERLGTFPEMSLGSARKRARGILGRVAGGEDPREDPVEEEVGVLSFKDAAERALSLMARRTRERTIQERRRILNRELLPSWGDRPVSEIRRGDVAALVEGIAGRGAPVMANRTLSLVRAIFNALLDMELAEANPATRPGRFMEEESPRERSLSREELKAILKAAEEEGPEARTFLSWCYSRRNGPERLRRPGGRSLTWGPEPGGSHPNPAGSSRSSPAGPLERRGQGCPSDSGGGDGGGGPVSVPCQGVERRRPL
jgi:hypothetical protein